MDTIVAVIAFIILIIAFGISSKIVNAVYRGWMKLSGANIMFFNPLFKFAITVLLAFTLGGLVLLPFAPLLGFSDDDSGRNSDYDYNMGTRQSAPVNNEKVSSVSSADSADDYASDVYVYPADDMYIYPTDTQYISFSELGAFSRHDIMLMRNEIYARHGYNFQNEEVRDYFMSKDWYYPVEGVNSSTFGVENMNEYERANLETIVSYEKEQGWR